MRRRLRTPLGDQEVRANDQGTNDHGWFLRSRTTTCIYLWYSGLGSKVQFRISIAVMEISAPEGRDRDPASFTFFDTIHRKLAYSKLCTWAIVSTMPSTCQTITMPPITTMGTRI